jgi:hypothetical protein
MLDSSASSTRLGLLGRPLFLYSVIPGGVENVSDLGRAIVNEPLAAAHYQGFRLARARVIRVNEERAVYASYRLDSHIYWTHRKLTIAKGETLITDGEITARARCGNQISAVPLAPVTPAEPAAEALETPEKTLPSSQRTVSHLICRSLRRLRVISRSLATTVKFLFLLCSPFTLVARDLVQESP